MASLRSSKRTPPAWKASLFTAASLWFAAMPAGAWSDHASLLQPVIEQMPALAEISVVAESLQAFLEAEADSLERLLDDEEQRARITYPHYAPRPDALAFRAEATDLRERFLAAIRVNPTLPYRLYRQLMPGQTPPSAARPSFSALSFLSPGYVQTATRYALVEPGERIAIGDVIASASDEPDFGMDVGLFEDNGTDFGARYGFGRQPFGDPKLDYGSQAPFHMGFYHLDWLTRTAQPDLLRTFPAWRVRLYGALSDHAFATGHPYWGWRFAGWALHYIGDMSQPYHAQPLPGVSTLQALWLVITGGTADAVQLVSNRHGVLESYQYLRLSQLLGTAGAAPPLLSAFESDREPHAFEAPELPLSLSAESVAAGAALDAALEAGVPARFVSEPGFEWNSSGEEEQLLDTLKTHGGAESIESLDAALQPQLERFAHYARGWIQRSLERMQTAPM